jgi:succinate dehydrogenase/fumarate reductase cytochrome b subunit
MNQIYESNPGYQQNGQYPSNSAPMSVKSWVGTLLLLCIPLVNLILLFVWAFGDGANSNKKNYAKASLIIVGCVTVIYVLFFVLLIGLVMNSGAN